MPLRRQSNDPAASGLGEPIRLVPELAQPAGDHRRAHPFTVVKRDACAADADPLVGRLDELAARRMDEACEAVGGELLGGADVEEIGRARRIAEPGMGDGRIDRKRAAHYREPLRPRPQRSSLGTGLAVTAIGIARELKPGEEPALRPVLQRKDGIGDAEVDQGLGADDRAGAAGAVHYDPGLRIGCDVADAQHELSVRAADAAGDAHLAVFGPGPAVDDDEIVAPLPHRLEIARGNPRGVALVLDDFAEHFARHVHALIKRVSRRTPRRHAAFEHEHVRIAERRRARRSPRGNTVPGVAQHQPRRPVRHQSGNAQLEAAVGQWHGEEQVARPVLAMLADIEERDFAAVGEPRLERSRVDRHRSCL